MNHSKHILSAISHHILEIVNLLVKRQIEEANDEELNSSSVNQSLDLKQIDSDSIDHNKLPEALETNMKILIVSNDDLMSKLKVILHETKTSTNYPHLQYLDFIELDITTLNQSQFLQAAYDTRYKLGCYIDPDCMLDSHSTLNDNNDSKLDYSRLENSNEISNQGTLTNNDNIINIIIRLRDLFAQQSLIILPTTKSSITLNPYGYEYHEIEINNESNHDWKLSAWHFNLYDYKKRPDWLNAKYWANPENFDKYRW